MLRPSAFILRRERVAVNRLSKRRANVLALKTQRNFASGGTETAELARFAVSPTNRRRILRVLEAVQSFTTASYSIPWKTNSPRQRISLLQGKTH